MENLVFEASKDHIESAARLSGVAHFVYTSEQDQRAKSDAETYGVGVVVSGEHIPVALIYAEVDGEDDGGGPVVAAMFYNMLTKQGAAR